MVSRETIKRRLERKKAALEAAEEAYIALLAGRVKSYTIGSRSMTKFDLPELEATISKLEREIDELDEALRGGKRRKAVGVVPRDY